MRLPLLGCRSDQAQKGEMEISDAPALVADVPVHAAAVPVLVADVHWFLHPARSWPGRRSSLFIQHHWRAVTRET